MTGIGVNLIREYDFVTNDYVYYLTYEYDGLWWKIKLEDYYDIRCC